MGKTDAGELADRLIKFTCRGKCSHSSCRMEREAAAVIKRQIKEIEHLRSPIPDAAVIEECAKVVEGERYCERYRKWRFWHEGNRASDSEIVGFADDAAAAIRSLIPEREVVIPESSYREKAELIESARHLARIVDEFQAKHRQEMLGFDPDSWWSIRLQTSAERVNSALSSTGEGEKR